jgi:hypothetical protein
MPAEYDLIMIPTWRIFLELAVRARYALHVNVLTFLNQLVEDDVEILPRQISEK